MSQAIAYRYRLEERELAEIADEHDRRLVATRMERVWKLVEFIAAHPGKSRKELALDFAVSERQTQADLNLIKRQMRLPLIRRNGYRFGEYDNDPRTELNLADAQLLIMLIGRARYDRSVPADRLRSLVAGLPRMAPLHLRPLITAGLSTDERAGNVMTQIMQGIVYGHAIQLHYPPGYDEIRVRNPRVKPQVVFPFGSRWYLLGHCIELKHRLMLFPLEHLALITSAS